MSRYYSPVNKEYFIKKVIQAFQHHEEEYEFTKSIEKDLQKVQFDRENLAPYLKTDDDDNTLQQFEEDCNFSNYPVGYREIEKDFHVFFGNAGGDWEFPICFVFYWDGIKLRAYIPSEGNVWNKKTKQAYGNDEDETYDNEELEKEISEEKLIEDIKNRIKIKK